MNGVIAEDLEVLLQDSSICIRCAGEIQGMDDELFEETGKDLEDFLRMLQHLFARWRSDCPCICQRDVFQGDRGVLLCRNKQQNRP